MSILRVERQMWNGPDQFQWNDVCLQLNQDITGGKSLLWQVNYCNWQSRGSILGAIEYCIT